MLRGSLRSATATRSISRSISTRNLLLATNNLARNKVTPTLLNSPILTRSFSVKSINQNQTPPSAKPETSSFNGSDSLPKSPSSSTHDYTKAKYNDNETKEMVAIGMKLQEIEGKVEELRSSSDRERRSNWFVVITNGALGGSVTLFLHLYLENRRENQENEKMVYVRHDWSLIFQFVHLLSVTLNLDLLSPRFLSLSTTQLMTWIFVVLSPLIYDSM